MNTNELKEYLDFKVNQYNTIEFVKTDPIRLIHGFPKKEDIEMALEKNQRVE